MAHSAEEIAEYRRKAKECRRLADKAVRSDQYFEWVTTAKSWDDIADAAERDNADKRLF